ncbi:hypothetical protein [Acetobacter thailandicus]|uniref:hypothetical protein n=1 Tax=Acetobacter thailandicus TaxID=1502842 RepID=UPI001BA6E549|nr:hypothetical protein [Acetobacter thailandicus]MBS0981496.1 hypothetical protein [Acetobacter thailandicus]
MSDYQYEFDRLKNNMSDYQYEFDKLNKKIKDLKFNMEFEKNLNESISGKPLDIISLFVLISGFFAYFSYPYIKSFFSSKK